MSKSEDISRLFSHLEYEPSGEYKEITKANEVEKSKSRWPILNKSASEKEAKEKTSFLSPRVGSSPTNESAQIDNNKNRATDDEESLINIFNRIKGHRASTEKDVIFKKLINK